MATPQFGQPQDGADYQDRPAAFGVAVREGRIALVFIQRDGEAAYHDLPGGGLDPGEGPERAVRREFGEETGLRVRAGALLGQAGQFMVRTDGQHANNRSTLFEVEIEGEEPSLKIEDDHTLVWKTPVEALSLVRHESHAWAIALWLRHTGQGG